MAKIQLAAGVPQQVHTGAATAVAFGNPSGSYVWLNTADPNTDGALVSLGYQDSMFLAAGGPEAAEDWWALSSVDTTLVVTSFA